MRDQRQLLQGVLNGLNSPLRPSLTEMSSLSDLYEAYVFSLVIQAARIEGAAIEYRDPDDQPAQEFVFRTSPGYIWSKHNLYTFALLKFAGVAVFEVHLGVRVSGKSGVLHEFDVCVLRRGEGLTCRQNQVHPRSSAVQIGIECKFYSAALGLGMGRAFLGLGTDVSAKRLFFVTNTTAPSVEKLLSARKSDWGNRIRPGSTVDVDRLRNAFQTVFKYHNAL